LSRKVYLSYIKLLMKQLLNRPRSLTKDITIGRGSYFGRNVRFNCKRVKIGTGVIFQDNIRIDATEFEIGDYGTVYFGCFFPGPGKISIGHNCWIGSNTVVDCQGGTSIGNNVCIGVQSQLWTHMKFGDVVAGWMSI
jgi:acetyltransferase-like isoleucine patch superfamily enzyme